MRRTIALLAGLVAWSTEGWTADTNELPAKLKEDAAALRNLVETRICSQIELASSGAGINYKLPAYVKGRGGETEITAWLSLGCSREVSGGGSSFKLHARLTLFSPLGKPLLFLEDRGVDGCVNARGGFILRVHELPSIYRKEVKAGSYAIYGNEYTARILPCANSLDYWQMEYWSLLRALVAPGGFLSKKKGQ